MSSNALTGSIPERWSSGFHALQMLDLHGNQLSGALPTGFGTAGALSALNNLVLNNNQFSGGPQLLCSKCAVSAVAHVCLLASRPLPLAGEQACFTREQTFKTPAKLLVIRYGHSTQRSGGQNPHAC